MPAIKLPPKRICIGLFIAITLDTAVQVLWKTAASGVDLAQDALTVARQAVLQPVFWAVGVLFCFQLFNWRKVLEHADLSFAQPITSLSYISVLALSAVLLHERVDVKEIVGVILILLGVYFISRTDHSTVSIKGPVEP